MRNRSGNIGDRLSGRAVAEPVRVRAECVMVQSLNSLRRGAVLVSVFVAAVLLVGTGIGTVAAQDAPTEEFSKNFGGERGEIASSVIETSDGGFALAGATTSFAEGQEAAWLVKTDSNGNEQFNKTYRGSGNQNRAFSVVETSDGGFAIAGETYSLGGGGTDALLIKTDSNGSEQFNKSYGGVGSDEVRSVIETSDGSIALAGSTSLFGKGIDAWLLKLSGSGNGEAEGQGLPGFTVVTAVLAVLTVAAAAVRRRST